MITRERWQYDFEITYYDTATHNKAVKEYRVYTQDGPEKALAKAWADSPRGDPPLVKADVKQIRQRRVCFTMTQEAFYSKAQKIYLADKGDKENE